MTAPARWRVVAVVALAVAVGPSLSVVRWARSRAARALAERDATAVAAYLALVTPGARGSADYDLPQLLIRARALDGLPGLSARFEVYHATAPLVHATAPPLPTAALERLRRKVAVRWIGAADVALAPLLDRDGWDVVGAVAVRPDGGGWPLSPWLLGALLLLLVAGVQALRAMDATAEVRQQALQQYWVAAALFGIAAFAGMRLAAGGATDRWLGDVRQLMQEAAARVPELRGAPAGLAAVARGAEMVPADSGPTDGQRRDIGGATRATVAVRLGPGRWLEVRARPGEAGVAGWLPGLLGLAALGPLGVWLAAWATTAAPRHRRETLAAWGFLAPSALHLVAFSCIPLLLVPYLSVHQWSPIASIHPFVGLANYGRVLGDPLLWSSLGHTLVYACSVPLSLALALGVALLVGGGGHRERRLWLLPGLLLSYVASVVAIGLVWRQLYHPDVGLIDRLLARAGLTPVNWLGDPRVALGAVIIVGVWMQFGYYVTVFLAALCRIPPSYLEAARVDGAGAWQRFWRVTFPLLRPVTLFALITGIISAFQVFALVVVLTAGGPLHGTDVVVYRIYRTAWERLQFGEASAQALLLCALLFGATWVQLKLLDQVVEHA